MDFMIILYIIFGLIPSLTWLFYYLKKDNLPESKRMILKIFFWGAFMTIPVLFLQMGLTSLIKNISINPFLASLIYWFLIISFTEEIFKYFVIKLKVINSPHLDEPIDVMIYMVVSALGFAAIENILYLFAPSSFSFTDIINRTLALSFIRFVGATFLHTLCSAIIGYVLALSLCKLKNRFVYMFLGLFIATTLHGLYDFSIIALEGSLKTIVPISILIILAILTSFGFEKLKEIKSICNLKTEN